MSGFSFPPPPPPPPKTGQSHSPAIAQPSDFSNRGRSRGRGYRRGRGDNQGGPSGRPPYQQNATQSVSHQHWSTTDSLNGLANGQHHHWQTTPVWSQPYNLPAGTFVNPNFVPHQNAPGRGPHSTGFHQISSAQSERKPQHGSPPRTFAGHKRKLEALRGPPPETKPTPLIAPSVPSFGYSSLPAAAAVSPKQASSNNQSQLKPQGKTNVLGLTPTSWDAQYSSSENENDADGGDVDEEALHAELGDKLTFEHNGIVMSLNSQADLAAWKGQRRKNWPTRARMAEKDIERRRVGEERKRLLAEARVLRFPPHRQAVTPKTRFLKEPADQQPLGPPLRQDVNESMDLQHADTMVDDMKLNAQHSNNALDNMKKVDTEREVDNAQDVATFDPTDLAGSTEEGCIAGSGDAEALQPADDLQERVGTQGSPSQGRSSSKSSSDITSDTSDEGSDDGPPEEAPSKPVEVETAHSNSPARVCRYFSASGYCRDGNACRFRHEHMGRSVGGAQQPTDRAQRPPHQQAGPSRPKLEQSTEKRSLYQRLLEQQQEQEDRLALKVIKYLGEAGFFKQSASA